MTDAESASRKNRVLVLGGAGFIGSNVVHALVRRGEQPRILTRPSRSIENLRDVLAEIDLMHGDFMDDNILRTAMRGVDTVFHLITTTFPNMVVESSNYDLLSNLLPTIRMLELARELGVRRVVYASSGGTIYGEPQEIPITEQHRLAPESAYGQSKLTIENYLSFYGRTTPIEVSILRLSNPYGPRQNPFGVQGLIAVAMGCLQDDRPMGVFGEGAAVRDYIYIDDVVSAMLLAADSPPAVHNISTGVGHTVAEVLDVIERVSGRSLRRKRLPERPGDVLVNVLDNRQAREALGWSPQIGLEEGISRTWRAMQSSAAP
jgi:UDP-glucose 4-epimerase